MNMLSEKELKTIKKICGENYAKRLRAIQTKQKNSSVKIVNTGMVSSGKSSLYNILIHSDKEFFPTGAARTTVKANSFDYKNISYIDTPGIDVRSEDDALAFSTIMESDIIMMIHNIRTGPLNKSEVEWLQQVTKSISSIEICRYRIVFVISWKDTREKEDDYHNLVQNVKQQVFDIIGEEIPVFEVSAKKYQQGIEKNKEILIRNSGVIELREYLEQYANEYIQKKRSIDIQEYNSLIDEVKEILMGKYNSNQAQTKKIYNRNQENAKSRRNAWQEVYDYFSMQRDRLSDLEEELSNV